MLLLAFDEVTEMSEIGSPLLLAIDITTAEFPSIFAAVTVTCEMTTPLTAAEALEAELTRASIIAKHDTNTRIPVYDLSMFEYYPP
jgi:hypothetical protein